MSALAMSTACFVSMKVVVVEVEVAPKVVVVKMSSGDISEAADMTLQRIQERALNGVRARAGGGRRTVGSHRNGNGDVSSRTGRSGRGLAGVGGGGNSVNSIADGAGCVPDGRSNGDVE